MDAITQVPLPANEPVHDYAPHSPERSRLVAALDALAADPIDLPHVIAGEHRLGAGNAWTSSSRTGTATGWAR
ncbi:hypothetical protein C1Y40_01132 [Mycobacterium talmoniae]|uniref:Uncharacterized protein n=1 Tax=Mycobacterium talmoniae TaxID=1858794 RepID=A0A2S8BPQ3_9MYCO|nr:hypothetical protein C1Y40_01132 [Mycobacterium talmoniae]